MSYTIAFDKEYNEEIFVFTSMTIKDDLFCSNPLQRHFIAPIGSLLLLFLNTDFYDLQDYYSFIFNYCFESLYILKYPEKVHHFNLYRVQISQLEFAKVLKKIAEEELDMFLYAKYTILKNLNLPYDKKFFEDIEKEEEMYKWLKENQ